MITFFKFKKSGRNNSGKITVRHRGGGFSYIVPNLSYSSSTVPSLSIKSFKFGFNSSVNVFVSPNFSAFNSYNLFFNRFNTFSPVKFLFECSIGQFLYDLELIPGGGPVFCRSYGSYCQLLRKRGSYATIKFPSGEIRKVSVFCSSKVWDSKSSFNRPKFSFSYSENKAGFNRNLGIRPHVRGCAINPVDHPHGGRTGESRPSVSPWAQLTKGYRTRIKPIKKKFVVLSVQDIKNRLSDKKSR